MLQHGSKSKPRRRIIPRVSVRNQEKLAEATPRPTSGAKRTPELPDKRPHTIELPLRVRVGENVRRPNFVPQLGEPLFTIDDRRFWMGDGVTPGGIPVTVSQWPIDSVDELKDLEDAELGDFAFYRDRSRCFMLVNPPPSLKTAWMEISVEPLRTDDEIYAEQLYTIINEYLTNVMIDNAFTDPSDGFLGDSVRTTPKRPTRKKINAMMTDRKSLHEYLYDKSPDKEFPNLEYKHYDRMR